MKFLHIAVAALAMLAGQANADTGSPILGIWNTPEGAAKIEVYRCGEKFCGKLLWLKEPNYPMDDDPAFAGKPKVDRYNPDPARRNDPVIGKEILKDLAAVDATSWSGGEIYDTKSGKTYRCKATLTEAGTLEMRGFIGISLIGRTSVWSRPTTQQGDAR